MKMKMFLAACALVGALFVHAEMPRSEWHALVSACAQNPATLKQTIGQLSAADQKAFVAEVNEALAAMPGSAEVKAAQFLAANRAAVMGATKENRTSVLAEVFATVPPEFLTVINEDFATTLFNRSSTSKPLSDAEYTAIAKNVMKTVVERCASVENGTVRAAFAAMMFVRASNGLPADLSDQLVALLPGQQEVAKNEWLPAALGNDKNYDAMLGAAQAGDEPDIPVVIKLDGFQTREALLGDLVVMSGGQLVPASQLTGGAYSTAAALESGTGADLGVFRVPRTAVMGSPRNRRESDAGVGAYNSGKRGENNGSFTPGPVEPPTPEPEPPYPNQVP